jgi:hypothetical protein
MLRRRPLAALLAVVALPLLAQNLSPPDLSGTWELNVARSKIPNGGSAGSEIMTIKCSGQAIEVHSASPGHDSTRTYVLDGKEHYADKMVSGSVQILGYSRAIWEGSTLFIKFRTHLDDPDHPTIKPPDEHASQRWTLSQNGRVLTVISSGSSAALNRDLVFDKQ